MECGFSLKEIAEFLGTSSHAIKGPIFRARQQLGTLLKSTFEGYFRPKTRPNLCAAFLERSNGAFRLVAWKGFETGEPAALEVAFDDINVVDWVKSPRIFHLDEDDVPIKVFQ